MYRTNVFRIGYTSHKSVNTNDIILIQPLIQRLSLVFTVEIVVPAASGGVVLIIITIVVVIVICKRYM